MDKKQNNITEGMFSTIDQIRQDSKDVRDFVKKVFADREFKKMSNDKDFIKYLKSIYEGTLLDEEAVAVSTRSADGTITTRIKEDSINEAKEEVTPKQLSKIQNDIKKINRKIKVYISKHPVTKGKLQIELGGDHPFGDGDNREVDKIDRVLKKHTGTVHTGTIFMESVNEAEIKWNAVDNAIVRYIKQNVKVLEKPIKARDEAGTKKMLKGFIDGLVNAQRSLKLESINEASIKGKNNKTGESFGMVIGSDKKNKQGEFEVTIRITYSSRISSYKFMFDKSSNLIAIKDYGYSMDGKFPDMKGGGSVKSVRPNPRETITQIAKVTSPAFAKKIYQHVKKVNESVNEWDSKSIKTYGNAFAKAYGSGKASKLAMGIAGFTGTRGSAVQKFIDDYNLNSRKLFNFVKKGKLKDRMDFVTAIAGKRGNKFQGKMVGMFGEGKDDGVPQGYNPMVESKTKESKVVQMIYKYEKKEKKFYDKMAEHEKRIGPREYGKFIINALRGFGINPREFKRVPDAEEKLYQTVSK